LAAESRRKTVVAGDLDLDVMRPAVTVDRTDSKLIRPVLDRQEQLKFLSIQDSVRNVINNPIKCGISEFRAGIGILESLSEPKVEQRTTCQSVFGQLAGHAREVVEHQVPTRSAPTGCRLRS
jgi:hypothetical protein